MLTQKTLHTLRIRGFSQAEIAQIETLAAKGARSGRGFDPELVAHAACGGDALALKLAPLVRERRAAGLDPALIDACTALGDHLRAPMR